LASRDGPPEPAGAKLLMLVDRQPGGRPMAAMFNTDEAMRNGDVR
jgi:hypothetical protein